MSDPPNPRRKPAMPFWAIAVEIPTTWTPEQALAVFELLDELREKVSTHYLSEMQDLLREQQGYGTIDDSDTDDADDQSF
jgi:hypothetical protein